MANIVLALQGGVANGSEATFDGQKMQPGVHLRWSFLAALGFPPGGFWLCRRAAKPGEKRIPLPPSVAQLQVSAGTTGTSSSPASGTPAPAGPPAAATGTAAAGAPAAGTPHTGAAAGAYGPSVPSVAGTTGSNQWQATLPAPCESVTLAGCAAPGCDEVIIETFSLDAKGNLQVSSRRAVPVEHGAFRICVKARNISCVRVVGAGSVDECDCGTVQPPKDCGYCGDGGGDGGNNPPGGGQPGWGPPNENGWQCWGVPFTLPVTISNWPARYFGAPDPNTTPASVVAQKDVEEAKRRLGPLLLAVGLTPASQQAELYRLRAELVSLVQGFPATLLADVPIADSPAGANAPNLNISLMQELILFALDPYMARVLGLYFVDDQVAAGIHYDYSITGFWGATPCQSAVIFPGLAPGAPLARGSATFGGLTIKPQSGSTSLWRWTKSDLNGNYLPRLDSSAPPVAQNAATAGLSGLTAAQQPAALLIAASQGVSFPFFAPPPQVSILLSQPMARVDVQVSGVGTVMGLSNGAVVSTANFGSSQLTTVTVNSPGPSQIIDQIQVNGFSIISPIGIAVSIGALTMHPISPDIIGTRYALIGPPVAIQPLPAPGQPFSTFRHRQADLDTSTLKLLTRSLIDVEWPAPTVTPAQQTGDPMSDPLALPPPTQPVGFVAERQDVGVAGSTHRIPGWIATRNAPKPNGSKVPTAHLFRLNDSQLADPVGGWSHRVAAFDLFGALGKWSNWSAPRQVEKIAAAPTAMRIRQFDNTPAGGGAPAPGGTAWLGGTLHLLVNWSGAAFMMYPDIVTARITVESIDSSGTVTGQLATKDLTVPAPSIRHLTVSSIVATLSGDGSSFIVDIQTNPPLAALGSFDPGQVLMLTLADGTTERYAVRPSNPLSPAPGPVVARIKAGSSARIVSTTSDFLGQPAYLLSGYSTQPVLSVPLNVPITQNSARAQVSVAGSTQNPFLAGEQIIDPNGINAPRPEPQSARLIFNGPQRLVPPAPPTPVHQVHHVYYDPADASGRAGKMLPFTTPAGPGISGYVLQRAPVRSMAIADIKRRIALGNLADNNPVVIEAGNPRPDLVAWIGALPQWLSAYNAINGTAWTIANVLNDSAAQRAFIEHFYGGLLDDELRALGDLAGNATGYARVNPQPFAPAGAISDTVDGTGYGRTLYRLGAVNAAGSFSSTTGSIGPFYTQIVTPPRPAVLYKLQATESAIVVAWALDTNPEVAGYLVYRAATLDALADLRYFGADWTHPAAPGALPSVRYHKQAFPPLSFVQGTPPNIDQRIIALVPDPRLCARDYDGSDMGEIALPPGPPPDSVNGVYRLSEYDPARAALSQLAFNYWTPPAVGGIAQLKTDSPTRSRLTGLRIGLGRGVAVVVVATWKGVVKVVGRVPVRRAGFVDGVASGGAPLDPNAIHGVSAAATNALNAYVVVAVDIFGNRSAPSKAFAAQMLAKASGF